MERCGPPGNFVLFRVYFKGIQEGWSFEREKTWHVCCPCLFAFLFVCLLACLPLRSEFDYFLPLRD